jgi:Uma2 family endonuclease
MTLANEPTRAPSVRGEPPWEILDILPRQGEWSEAQYLSLDTNRLVELVDGCLEFPPMPNYVHQQLAALLWMLLRAYAARSPGSRAVLAPFKLRIDSRNYREPDVLFLRPENAHRFENERWTWADFIIEIVSPSDPARDYVLKRADYARLGVAEYWIVDIEKQAILQLVLDGRSYTEFAAHPLGATVQARTLPGFSVDFASLIADAQR